MPKRAPFPDPFLAPAAPKWIQGGVGSGLEPSSSDSPAGSLARGLAMPSGGTS